MRARRSVGSQTEERSLTLWYGAAYYPEHRDPAKWELDLDNMVEANINALRVGEFAWKRFEPQPGCYEFGWMDDFQIKASQRGISLVMCPPLRTAPAWLVEQEPTVMIELADGVRHGFGSRYTFCINHPVLREKGAALSEALAAHYANTNIISWHLDNEQGDEPDCHCPICRVKWQEWLHQRFNDIDQLNQAWGMVFWGLEFDHFGQVPTPRITKTDHNPGLLIAWRQFRSECTTEVIALQAAAVRKHAKQPVTTNYQPLWNARTDYFVAAENLDECGTNYYPPFGGNYRALALGLATTRGFRKQNFSVFELKNGPHIIPGRSGNTPAPGELERLVVHVVANGADGIYFFRWRACPFGSEQSHGTLTGYDGQKLRVFEECKKAGARLKRIAHLLAGSEVVSDMALLYDFPTRWYLDNESHWQPEKGFYTNLCKRLYTALGAQGVNVDATGRNSDWSNYRALIVPGLDALNDAICEKLASYVNQGGTLIWHPMGGLVNEHAVIYSDRLHPRLVELFGLRPLNVATGGAQDVSNFTWHGKEYQCRLFFELPDVTTGQVTGEYSSDWYASRPAVVEKPVGKGRVVYLATYPDNDFYTDFFADLIKVTGVTRLVAGTLPATVEVTERRAVDGRRLLFMLSSSSVEQTVQAPGKFSDVWNDEVVEDQVMLPPNGVRVLVPQGD